MKTTPLLAALALAGLHTLSFADDAANRIEVTATRLPANSADQPVKVQIITRDDIERSAATTVPELLAGVAGITVSSADSTGNGTIDIGGFGVTGASNTLILLDGVKLNDNDLSSPRLSGIALDRIERIEIVGSSGVAWGGGATGGVVNLITREAKGGNWALRMGSFGTREATAGAGFGDTLSLRLAGRAFHSDGYRENSNHDARAGSAELGWKMDGTRLSLGVAREEEDFHFPGPRKVDPSTGLDQFDDNPWGSSTKKDHGETTNTRYTLHGDGSVGALRWAADASTRRKTIDSHFEDDFGGISLDQRAIHEDRFSPRAAYAFGSADIAAGIDLSHARMDDANQYLSALYPSAGAGVGVQHTRAFWLDAGYRVLPGTRLTVGGRVEHADDVLYANGAAAVTHNHAPKAFEFGLRQTLVEGVSLFARYGQSYRYPNTDELVQNPDLRTQTSHDLDLGIEGRFGPGQWRLSGFSHEIVNEISYQPFAGPFGYGQNINLSPTRHRGATAEWSAHVDALDYGVNASWQDAVFRSGNYGGGDVSGKAVPLVPRWQANLRAGWVWTEATRFDMAVHGEGRSRLDNDQGNTAPWLGGHTTLDAKLTHKVANMTLSLSVQNLTDKRFATYGIRNVYGANYNLYPEPGRRWQAAASYAF